MKTHSMHSLTLSLRVCSKRKDCLILSRILSASLMKESIHSKFLPDTISILQLEKLPSLQNWFAAIKEAGSQSELTGLLVDNPNAVAVLDYTLFDTSAEYLLILQERFKEAHFVLFSDNLSEDFIRRMVFSGTSFSVVMKDAPMIEIEEGLRKAKQHLQYMCTRAVWLLQHKEDKKDKLVSPLTVTEREILKLMALGKTTKEIAAERFLSVYTVMTHRKNIFRKLEVNNVHEATKYALRAGIVDVVEYYI